MNQALSASASILDTLVQEIAVRLKHDSPSGTPSLPYMHGPGGLFSARGLERDLISTRIQPFGIADRIPARSTLRTDPLFGYVTGFQNGTGTEKDGVCDDPPIAGPVKNCIQTAQFGRFERMTRELEINRVGQQTDRAEFMDLRLMNDPILGGEGNNFLTPGVPGNLQLNREVLMRFTEVGVAFQNLIAPKVWTGNPANNTGGGGYKEFPGLDILIGTNKVDALTGISCPSLASLVVDYNYTNLDSVGTGGTDIVNVLTYMTRSLKHNASRMNFGQTKWALVMRPGLFYELTNLWPCSYMTYRCIERISGSVTFDAGDAISMRDAMRQGNYLVIDGEQWEVLLDDAIVEESNTTSGNVANTYFASDIYIVPLTVRGGIAVTYWEYLDYTNGAMVGAADGRMANDDFWTDGGRFLWHKKPPTNWCVQFLAKIEPRIILLTPHLAGKLQNVQYRPFIHERDAFPTDPYFVDGGVTSRPGPSNYSDWNLPV